MLDIVNTAKTGPVSERLDIRLPAKNDHAPPLGNFADIVYLKEQSFVHRIRDVCTL